MITTIIIILATSYINGVIMAWILWYGRHRYYYKGLMGSPFGEILRGFLLALFSWFVVIFVVSEMFDGKTRIEMRG